jgi:hypothetical protein
MQIGRVDRYVRADWVHAHNADNCFQTIFFWGGGVDECVLWLSFAQQK